MILLLTAIAVPVVSVVMFMCLKTAGVTPKNFEELAAEIRYQVYGILAIAEDFILISKNKFSGKFFYYFFLCFFFSYINYGFFFFFFLAHNKYLSVQSTTLVLFLFL